MTQPAKATEPSMEEILASIRRIISDDDTASKAPPMPPRAAAQPLRADAREMPAPVPQSANPPVRDRAAIESDIKAVLGDPANPAVEEAPAASADPDILELTEDMAAEPPTAEPAPEAAAPSFRTIDGQPDVFFAEPPAEPEPEPEPESEPEPEPLHSVPAEAATAPFGFEHPYDRSLMSQATSAAVDSAFNQLAQSVFTQNGRTIEDLVRDMLRPMLKTWLDDNLPGLVERLVRAEIERVSRGR